MEYQGHSRVVPQACITCISYVTDVFMSLKHQTHRSVIPVLFFCFFMNVMSIYTHTVYLATGFTLFCAIAQKPFPRHQKGTCTTTVFTSHPAVYILRSRLNPATSSTATAPATNQPERTDAVKKSWFVANVECLYSILNSSSLERTWCKSPSPNHSRTFLYLDVQTVSWFLLASRTSLSFSRSLVSVYDVLHKSLKKVMV